MIEKFFREKANGNPLHEFSVTLQDIPTKGLLDYLCYLIRVNDPARVQCIRIVFKARLDHHRYNVTFNKNFGRIRIRQIWRYGGATCQNLSFS